MRLFIQNNSIKLLVLYSTVCALGYPCRLSPARPKIVKKEEEGCRYNSLRLFIVPAICTTILLFYFEIKKARLKAGSGGSALWLEGQRVDKGG